MSFWMIFHWIYPFNPVIYKLSILTDPILARDVWFIEGKFVGIHFWFYFSSLSFFSCPTDPLIIPISNSTNSSQKFYFSFSLYHILKEPIPFKIECQLEDHRKIDCSSNFDDSSPNEIRSTYCSLPIEVTRNLSEQKFDQTDFDRSSSLEQKNLSKILFFFALDSNDHHPMHVSLFLLIFLMIFNRNESWLFAFQCFSFFFFPNLFVFPSSFRFSRSACTRI